MSHVASSSIHYHRRYLSSFLCDLFRDVTLSFILFLSVHLYVHPKEACTENSFSPRSSFFYHPLEPVCISLSPSYLFFLCVVCVCIFLALLCRLFISPSSRFKTFLFSLRA
ncbi:hypothetical protein CSUI_011371 [Cystoisospora suis]|uniref:Transmembrane protein n=1 Tax=Cystoisospora suis TaxID=483139 RepID=A0A2C6KBI2_9APIC|nr:hypothetical protein CSUI_011371 [Cystoisospora suis]